MPSGRTTTSAPAMSSRTRRSRLGRVGDHRQRPGVLGRAHRDERLLRRPVAVERRGPCFDGADALPLHLGLSGRFGVDRGLHVLPTEFVPGGSAP